MKTSISLRTLSLTVVGLVTLAGTAPAFAGPPSGDADPAARTGALVGTWEGPSTFVLDGKTMQPKLTMRCARPGAGPAVTCDTTFTGVAGFDLEEHELLAYDRATDTFHLFTANNYGEAYDHTASWKDPHVVSFEYVTARKGKTFREDYRFEWTSASELRVSGTDTVDGQVVAQATATLRRTS